MSAVAEEKEARGFMAFWNWLSHFLHNAQLIPLVVVVEGYHYYVVLSSHDRAWAAIPLALFLDLLHFRTIQQAIETKKVGWIIGAVLSTAVTYAFQFIFYSSPGQDGHVLELWKQLLFAAVVPFGIVFMVWHHYENKHKVIRDGLAELKVSRAENDVLQDELEKIQDELELKQGELKGSRADLKVSQDELDLRRDELERIQDKLELIQGELKLNQDELKVSHDELETSRHELRLSQNDLDVSQREFKMSRDELEKMRNELDVSQNELAELKAVSAAWSVMNLRTQLAAQVKAKQVSMEEAAERAGVSLATMKREVVRINGSGG